MKSKKIIITMMLIIICLLATIIIGIILNVTNSDVILKAQTEINKIAQNSLNGNLDTTATTTEQISSIQNMQEIRLLAANGDLVSRSDIDRQNETLYINLTQEEQVDYEEIITYINPEDLKISFNMDVSKTTGLSQEDFVVLVQNMKCDKTGILEKNAAWIWECCQKYNVNEIFVLGICGIESAWCSAPQHQNTHNYCSMMKGGKLISYSSDEAGFEAMIKLLGQKYLSPKGALYHGATITGVGTKYCNTTTWPPKVYKCMQQVLK